MNLLRVIHSLDPRNGGPAAGLRAITPELAAQGHRTEFVSSDDPARVRGFNLGETVHALGPVRPGYGFNPRLDSWLRANATKYDVLFVHGLWQYHGKAVRSALGGRRPYFVFPHGMLDPWFRKAYPIKHAKKWLYWQFCEKRVLRDAAAVLFTCEEERRLANHSFRPYHCTERVVSYGTARPGGDPGLQRSAFAKILPELGNRPYFLFLGRVHQKKGVDLLIDAYVRYVAEDQRTDRVCPALVIAGPCEDQEWLAALKANAARVPPKGLILWPGMLEGDAKTGALRGAEAFVLPSHQENFGIAIAEALAVGIPVLVSNKVNIFAEIAEDRAGLVEPDTAEGAFRLLVRWGQLDNQARQSMGSAASASFERRFEIRRSALSLVETITPFIKGSS